MATLTSGYPKILSLGDYNIYLWRLTAVSDTETLATGLGARAIAHFVTWSGDTTTQAEGGGNSTLSAGTITLYPAEDALGCDVMVIANG